MGFFNFLPKEDQYFDLFSQMTLYISAAARELKEMLADKNREYGEYAQRIKGLEHACDELTHSIATRLNKSFITPFDREDIYLMSKALDDVVDLISKAPYGLRHPAVFAATARALPDKASQSGVHEASGGGE